MYGGAGRVAGGAETRQFGPIRTLGFVRFTFCFCSEPSDTYLAWLRARFDPWEHTGRAVKNIQLAGRCAGRPLLVQNVRKMSRFSDVFGRYVVAFLIHNYIA